MGPMAADRQGNLYLGDGQAVRKITPAGPQGDVTTWAGNPDYDPGDDCDGPAAQARFNHPAAVVVAADGTLYVADQDNNCIRVIRSAASQRP